MKQEIYQINNITRYFKELEKEEQTKSKPSRRRETIKIRADQRNREQKTKKPIEKLN